MDIANICVLAYGRDALIAADRVRLMMTWRHRGSAIGKRGSMELEPFDNVLEALCDTVAEAANMKARAELMLAIRDRIADWSIAQEEAVHRLGLTRPRLNDLLRGKIDRFSLDALVNIATAAGYALHIDLEDVT